MADQNYNISREAAAQYLGVSTRTIDRYVKSWKLSYKKVANKVILAKDEVDAIKDDFSLLRQDAEYTEVISSGSNSLAKPAASSPARGGNDGINERLDQFFVHLTEKDKAIEDKNKVIFVLQQKLGELEGRMKSMIALPDYTEEKQKLIIEKERLETKLKEVYSGYKGERTKNIVWMSIMFIVILAVIIFIFVRG